MSYITFHNANQNKTTDFIAELDVLAGLFKPLADLKDAIDTGIIIPKIFSPHNPSKHGYIIMLIGHNDEELVE